MEHALETEALWRDFHDQLLAYIRGRVSNAEDAEDILHDVFLRVQKSRSQLGEVRNVAAWLYKVTSNAVIDYYRARKKATGALTGLANETRDVEVPVAPGGGASEDSSELQAVFGGCVSSLLALLPESYSEAVRMTDLEGVTQKEAANRLGLSTSGMKSRVQRGRAQLKDRLLECCDVELDSRRKVVSYEPRGDDCGECDCS
jgi:RNA polymerase sigma-70 factor (ECF subfamily)